jgi:hypothetical protein
MTLKDFLHADEMEQVEVFWNGTFVGSRRDGGFVIECRQVNDFYVEYTILGGHYIDMHVFKDPELLQPYLDQVDISSLGFD